MIAREVLDVSDRMERISNPRIGRAGYVKTILMTRAHMADVLRQCSTRCSPFSVTSIGT